MLRLEKINGKNVWDILKLEVSDNQKSFVAANNISIIEAYTAITGNGYAFPFAIYEDDTPVGFLMIGFDVYDYWDDAPGIAKGNYNLWRLMIKDSQTILCWICFQRILRNIAKNRYYKLRRRSTWTSRN